RRRRAARTTAAGAVSRARDPIAAAARAGLGLFNLGGRRALGIPFSTARGRDSRCRARDPDAVAARTAPAAARARAGIRRTADERVPLAVLWQPAAARTRADGARARRRRTRRSRARPRR